MTALVVDHDQPALGEDATALFSPDRTYRYALTRRWDDRPMAAFIMLNPSTADAFVEDATVRRCITRARRLGAGGLLVLNLFGLRSTNPDRLYTHPDPVGPDNDWTILGLLSDDQDPVGPVICAWGAHGAHLGRAARVLGLIAPYVAQPLCLGLTRGGQPRHPLYLRSDVRPIAYMPREFRPRLPHQRPQEPNQQGATP